MGRMPKKETLRVGLLLAAVGGFLDAYTYLIRGGVFANAQTGNMVLMSIRAAEGEWKKAGYYLIPIIAFFLGILVVEQIKRRISKKRYLEWEHFILLVEIVLLGIVGFCPESVPDSFINITVAFVCSVQVHSFRKVHDLSYASTMCTGNLRSAAEKFALVLFDKNKKAMEGGMKYMLIILWFCLGAAVGTICSGWLKERAVWVCCCLLAGAFVMMTERKKHENLD